MRTALAAGFIALVSLGAGVSVAQTSGDGTASERQGAAAAHLQEGKDAYAHWCATCHAAEGSLAGTLALRTRYESQRPAALEDRTDLTPELVAYFVRNGVAWMPSFRPTELSDAQVAAIGAYLSAPLEQRGAHAPLLAEEMMARQENAR